MRKIKKVFVILIVTFLLFSIFNEVFSIVFPEQYEPGELTKQDVGIKALDKVGIILGAIRNISVVVAVIALMIIGFKYMIGSVEEKANYKATLVPYIIGIIVAISGITLVSFIYNAFH